MVNYELDKATNISYTNMIAFVNQGILFWKSLTQIKQNRADAKTIAVWPTQFG